MKKTIEEKAKAYDEALKRAKKSLRAASDIGTDIVTFIFPQLAESEDERIIQFFAELATDACGGPGQEYYEELGLNYDKVMAWLEKQKEQKPAEWSEEDKENLDAAIDMAEHSLYEPLVPRDALASFLKSLRAQKKED